MIGTDKPNLEVSSFTIWTLEDMLNWEPPEHYAIMSDDNGPLFAVGQAAGILGAGGLGKTRFVMNMAVAQILGRDFCGFAMHSPARKWLFISNENSKMRMKSDLSAIVKGLSEEERELLNTHLYLHVQEQIADAILDIATEEGRRHWVNTLSIYTPDILVVDPFEALVPDTNQSDAVRIAMTTIQGLLRAQSEEASVLYIHHARTGAANTRQAVGYDAGNYVKGSKTFFSICRFIINMAQGDAEDRSKIVVACGKSNDSLPFKTRGAILDAEGMTYRLDPDFDLEAWINDVEGNRGTGKTVTVANVVMAVDSGHYSRKDILNVLTEETGASRSSVDRRLADACKAGYIEPSQPRGSFILTDKGRNYAKSHR